MRATIFALLLLGWAVAPACADDAPDSAAIQHNRDILAATPAAVGVFVVQDDGAIRHVQSGMICPAKLPNVVLWHLEVFPNKAGAGMDVACDYGRNGPDNQWIAKLTLFATVAPEGWKLDDVFANYRGEVLQANPGIRSVGEALTDQSKPADDRVGEWRSEAFVETRGAVDFTSELIVALRGPWMFEVRSTYAGKPGVIAIEKGQDANDAVNAAGDRIMAAQTFLSVAPTLPK